MQTLLPTVDMSFFNKGLDWQTFMGPARTYEGVVLNGIFHRKFKQTEHTLVYVKGWRHSHYIYPLIDRSFSSAMNNDYNLCFVGGWNAIDQDGLWLGKDSLAVERVIQGLKPMCWCNALKSHPDHVDDLMLLEKRASAAGLSSLRTETKDHFRLSVCHSGQLDDMFDLDSLQADYNEFHKKIRNFSCDDFFIECFSTAIDRIRGKYLEEFINWNNESERGIRYIVLTGLFLGFPPETTYSILTR